MNKNNYCIIMAGGVGSRFWPVSTSRKPKQYHDILGTGRTLIQQTFDRLSKLVPQENIYIITNHNYIDITKEQLPDISPSQIVGEPEMKNTAACNIYMAEKIYRLNPEANLLIAPADHLILDEATFIKRANEAYDQAEKTKDLITLGITPSRPDTGFGYIHFIEDVSSLPQKVNSFKEKPNLAQAKEFLKSGNYLWNSGIFIWSAKVIIEAFKEYLPEMYAKMASVGSYNTPQEVQDIAKVYSEVENTSIDIGILEKADRRVWVIPSSFGWSDLGTWGAVYENFDKNEQGNAEQGDKIYVYNSGNSVIKECVEDKVVVIDGLNNYIVVDTEEALLICPRDKDQKIKQYLEEIKNKIGDGFL